MLSRGRQYMKPVEDPPPEDKFQSEVFEASVAELFGDIKNLDNELRSVVEKIEALAPAVEDVDKRWLAGRSRALTKEFETVVSEVLEKESAAVLDAHIIEFRRASDRLTALSNQRDSPIVFIASVFVGLIAGVAGACIAVSYTHLTLPTKA